MKKILLSSVVAVALLTGCGEEKPVETKQEVKTEVKKEVAKVETPKVEAAKPVETKTPEQKLVEQVKESSSKVADTMKTAGTAVASKIAEESKELAKVGTEAVKSVTEKVTATTEEVTKEVVEKASETKDKIEQSLNSIVETKKAETAGNAIDGKALYLKCAGCHGQTAEKAALGKSQVVKGWDKEKIAASLKGYKAGTYGGVMKGVMKSQVATMSDEEIDALSAYIASF